MAFRISITREAESQWQTLSAREQRIVEAAVVSRLRDRPMTPTRAVRRLRPNPVAGFELRVGDFRILYDVEGEEVILHIIGRKVRNTLIVAGEEFHEHQVDPTEPAGGGPRGDPE
jgi:mRNA-degrading endonuclease RelE of RelBE toxin-antitoxin system